MGYAFLIPLTLTLWLNFVVSYNVLVLFPEPVRSHSVLGDGYVRILLEAHHKVTYITAFPWTDPPVNLTQLDLSSNIKTSSDIFQNLTQEYTDKYKFLLMRAFTLGAIAVNHPAVQAFLRDPAQQFDVVVAEWIDSELLSGFAGFFNCPLVWAISTQMFWQPMRLMDEYPNPAYSVDIYSGYTPPLSFVQRARQLSVQVARGSILHYSIHSKEVDLYKTVFGSAALSIGLALPAYEDIHSNFSMMLVNSHPTVATPWRLPPSIKEVAGYHVMIPPEPLPSHLQSIVAAANQGVVYFDMDPAILATVGSNQIIQQIAKVFGELNQMVLWKLDVPMVNVPANVQLMKWAPQSSILSHPNLKAFITHGGMVSTIEAVHFGVPVIGIPFKDDQGINIDALVKKGMAIKLDIYDDLAGNLRSSLTKILHEERYKVAAESISKEYHDRPVPPAKELIHWIEYVIRTNGAKHLRSPALLVPSYQKFYLDLAALITAVITITLGLIAWGVVWLVRRVKRSMCCGKR